MNIGQVAYFEGRLRARLVELREGLHDALFGSDAADQAFAAHLVDANFRKVTREAQEIDDIAAARRRMLLGQYGLCVQCDEPIDPKRLGVYPTAKRCLQCQRTYERSSGS